MQVCVNVCLCVCVCKSEVLCGFVGITNSFFRGNFNFLENNLRGGICIWFLILGYFQIKRFLVIILRSTSTSNVMELVLKQIAGSWGSINMFGWFNHRHPELIKEEFAENEWKIEQTWQH